MKVIIVSHGTLADSLLSSAKMILGDLPDDFISVGLTDQDNLDILRDKLVSQLGACAKALLLVDFLGGTPCNAALWASQDKGYQVVSGVNLMMVLEVALNRDSLSVEELADLAAAKGQQSIMHIDLPNMSEQLDG